MSTNYYDIIPYNIAEPDSKVSPHHTIHTNLLITDSIIREGDTNLDKMHERNISSLNTT